MRSDGAGVRLIRLWADALVSPPERLIHDSKLGVVGLWQNYIDLRHVRQQNKDLQKTIDRLRLEQAALLEDARQGQRLQAMLGLSGEIHLQDGGGAGYRHQRQRPSQVFYIDKGSDDELKPRHGGDFGGRDRGQGARRVSAFRAGAGHQ